MDFEQIRALVEDDMRAVDDLIRARLQSDVALINELGQYIVSSGGKRLRPALVLLSAKACDYRGAEHVELATVIEFIHTATLLHDDVVDASDLRRGNETANAIWGNEASVLVGDFLYSRAFQMMVAVRSMRVMEIMADATNTIAEGEVIQLLNRNDPDTTEERYLQVIYRKTAKLFEAGAQLGALLGNAPSEIEQALARYGMHIGTAFQLIDDVLDYSASSEEIGKNIGDDLADGKPTMPLIYAMQMAAPRQVKVIRGAIEGGERESIEQVRSIIASTKAIKYTTEFARREAEKAAEALGGLPPSPYKTALHDLTHFAVERDH
jgi:octaprenyl-diphosphate synthase